MGGCSSSGSVAVTAPVPDAPKTEPVTEAPKTLLTGYVAGVKNASESDVKAVLEGLSLAEQTKLADALNSFNTYTEEECVSDKREASTLKVLVQYLAEFNAASECDVKAALQGLSADEKKKLMDALNSFPAGDVEPAASVETGINVVADVADAVAEASVMLTETAADTMASLSGLKESDAARVSFATSCPPDAGATYPQASAWACCVPRTDATTEIA